MTQQPLPSHAYPKDITILSLLMLLIYVAGGGGNALCSHRQLRPDRTIGSAPGKIHAVVVALASHVVNKSDRDGFQWDGSAAHYSVPGRLILAARAASLLDNNLPCSQLVVLLLVGLGRSPRTFEDTNQVCEPARIGGP